MISIFEGRMPREGNGITKRVMWEHDEDDGQRTASERRVLRGGEMLRQMLGRVLQCEMCRLHTPNSNMVLSLAL